MSKAQKNSKSINEISMKSLASYKMKAADQAREFDKVGEYSKADKRFSGIIKATKKQFAKQTKTTTEGTTDMSFKNFRQTILEKTLTPAEKKKREEIAQAIERENPNMPMAKKMAIATAQAKKVAEETSLEEAHQVVAKTKQGETFRSAVYPTKEKAMDMHYKMAKSGKYTEVDTVKVQKEEVELNESHFAVGDRVKCIKSGMTGTVTKLDKEDGAEDDKYYTVRQDSGKMMKYAPNELKPLNEQVDDEGKMARGQLMKMSTQASALAEMMSDDKQLDGWVQSKLTKAADYLDSVHDYLMHNKQDVDETEDDVYEDMHYCAKHVRSDLLGDGLVLEGQHAEPDENGYVQWYMVEFKDGVRKVFAEDVKIMFAEYHMNHKKKKKQ